MSPTGYSIGAKIFGAFVAMGAIIAILGAAGYGVLASAGDMAVTTFDGPLMAINYARAAQTDFTQLQMDELRYENAAAADKGSIASDIADAVSTFNDDLAVAEQRSFATNEQHLIRQIKALVGEWRGARTRDDMKALSRLDTQIDDKFDLLIELNTDSSFVKRRQTVANVANYRFAIIGATALALLLAAAITLFLRRRIIRPLSAAAAVADRIAKGELQTEIPPGLSLIHI